MDPLVLQLLLELHGLQWVMMGLVLLQYYYCYHFFIRYNIIILNNIFNIITVNVSRNTESGSISDLDPRLLCY